MTHYVDNFQVLRCYLDTSKETHMPKADIKRDEIADHPAQNMANLQVKLAGSNLAPLGFEYQASVAVHFYKQRNSETFAFICQQTDIYKLPEGQVDVGVKELRKALMKSFGREENRRSGYDN